MTYEYKLENFLSVPIDGDKRLIINDKNGNYVDSIITDLSHYFVKNNCLVIKITNKNDLILSFESRTVAQQALEKLDNYRKALMAANGQITPSDRPTFNTLNHYMIANSISGNFQLATAVPILQQPKSSIKIIVNQSTFVYCGKPTFTSSPTLPDRPIGCYFTSPTDNGDPLLARMNDGDVQINDQLYWIIDWYDSPNYPLDTTDTLDFEFLI